jgi:hypothetical protein
MAGDLGHQRLRRRAADVFADLRFSAGVQNVAGLEPSLDLTPVSVSRRFTGNSFDRPSPAAGKRRMKVPSTTLPLTPNRQVAGANGASGVTSLNRDLLCAAGPDQHFGAHLQPTV